MPLSLLCKRFVCHSLPQKPRTPASPAEKLVFLRRKLDTIQHLPKKSTADYFEMEEVLSAIADLREGKAARSS